MSFVFFSLPVIGDKSGSREQSSSLLLSEPKCHCATFLSPSLREFARSCDPVIVLGVPWLPKLHIWAVRRCYWGNDGNCLEKKKRKNSFSLYKRRYKGLKIWIKSMLIRARGKDPIYWRRGSGIHIKTLNRLVRKGEEGYIQHMLGSFYGCSHNRMSCCSLGEWREQWWDAWASTLQVIQKQTMKPAASHRKTPLWNNDHIFSFHCTLLPAYVTFLARLLGLLLSLFHVSPENSLSCSLCLKLWKF